MERHGIRPTPMNLYLEKEDGASSMVADEAHPDLLGATAFQHDFIPEAMGVLHLDDGPLPVVERVTDAGHDLYIHRPLPREKLSGVVVHCDFVRSEKRQVRFGSALPKVRLDRQLGMLPRQIPEMLALQREDSQLRADTNRTMRHTERASRQPHVIR